MLSNRSFHESQNNDEEFKIDSVDKKDDTKEVINLQEDPQNYEYELEECPEIENEQIEEECKV